MSDRRIHGQDKRQQTIEILLACVFHKFSEIISKLLLVDLIFLLNYLSVFIHINGPVFRDSSQHFFEDLNQHLRIIAVKCNFGSMDVLLVKLILLEEDFLLLLLLSFLEDPCSGLFSAIHPDLISRVVGSSCNLAFVILGLVNF